MQAVSPFLASRRASRTFISLYKCPYNETKLKCALAEKCCRAELKWLVRWNGILSLWYMQYTYLYIARLFDASLYIYYGMSLFKFPVENFSVLMWHSHYSVFCQCIILLLFSIYGIPCDISRNFPRAFYSFIVYRLYYIIIYAGARKLSVIIIYVIRLRGNGCMTVDENFLDAAI